MTKHILNLTNQLTSKAAAIPEPETASPKKEIAPEKDDTLKMDTSLKMTLQNILMKRKLICKCYACCLFIEYSFLFGFRISYFCFLFKSKLFLILLTYTLITSKLT
jgi:hypothetical protein